MPLSTVTLDGSGIATAPNTFAAAATPLITATYTGDNFYNPATLTSFTQTVKWGTATALASAPNPSSALQSVTLTATVTSTGGTPTGTVTFLDGATSLGTGALNGSGVATLSTSALTVGTHSVTAAYGGAATYATSTSTAGSQVVNLAATSTAIASSSNPVLTAHSVTLSATVTGTGGTPTGTVQFYDGGVSVGGSAVNGSSVATYTTASLSAGTHLFTAVYSGDTNFATSTAPTFSQVVNKNGSAVSLSSGTNPASLGQFVTFTATATGTFGTPTGTVTFLDGPTPIGTAGVNAGGVATLPTSALTAGTHTITATYNGDGTYTPITSTAVTQVVTIPTTVALTSSANPSVLAASVTFTATVTGTSGTPTGTVTFLDGATTLGTGTIAGWIGHPDHLALTAGTHTITVSYGGAGNCVASTSAVVFQVVIRTSLDAVTSNANPSTVGQCVTFTTTVTGAGRRRPAR